VTNPVVECSTHAPDPVPGLFFIKKCKKAVFLSPKCIQIETFCFELEDL
jgi:hypothetical protein